jgi:hypothetical protein
MQLSYKRESTFSMSKQKQYVDKDFCQICGKVAKESSRQRIGWRVQRDVGDEIVYIATVKLKAKTSSKKEPKRNTAH